MPLGRDRGDGFDSGTAAGYVCYCIDRLFEFYLQSGDFSCRLAEPVEQFSAFVQELLAGRRGTGNEIVRTNVQSGLLIGQWSIP